ncbi:putative autotransporter protein [Yersinia rohdei]|uniref:Putative autotransporter protein n=1 Tax=Yersinia rohdei TaxID=29485 RepID=A0A0U1HNZ8_YERRO|nr:autotransporter outer membrane beta-barrel domain-containing protein [Yersinia rohdei]CQI88279.1 putative autotransporter protein [Yersinia rohdei]
MANNGLYATGVGSQITANNGDIYINTYAKNFLELLGENASYTEGASAEYGREFSIGNGNFIEPQGQLVYTHINKANYATSSGLQVNQDNINSVIGRAGMRVGHRFEENSNNDIYLKADLLHEFAGDRNVTVRGKDAVLVNNQDGKDSWITYGIGTNIQLTEDNNSRFYLDLEKSSGGNINTNWQVNAGLRWEW